MDERAQIAPPDFSITDPVLYRQLEQFRNKVFSAGKPEPPSTPRASSEPRLSPLHNSPLSTPRTPRPKSAKTSPRATSARATISSADTQPMYSVGIGLKTSNQVNKSTFWQPPPENLDKLKERLQVEYGTLFMAWQNLDKEARGFLGRENFRKTLIEAGFNGRFSVLWTSLDAFGHGVVTLAELDRSVARDLQQLKQKTGVYTGLRSALLRMGYHGDSVQELSMLFNVLDCSNPDVLALQFAPQIGQPMSHSISWYINSSISWFDKWNTDITPTNKEMGEFTHEAEGMAFADEINNSRVKLSGGLHIPAMTTKARQQATEKWKLLDSRHRRELLENAKNVAPSTVEEVLLHSKVKHGNLIRAWRREIEPERCFIGWREFVKRLRYLNFRGNLAEALIDVGAEDTGVVELESFAPEEWTILVDFRRWSDERFGSVQATWDAIDPHKMTRVPRNEFAQRIKQLGWDGGNPKMVFDYLVLDTTSGATGTGDYHAIQKSTFMWIDKVRSGQRPGLQKDEESDDSSDDGHRHSLTQREFNKGSHRRPVRMDIGQGLKIPAPTARAAEWQEKMEKWRQAQRNQKLNNQRLDCQTSNIEAFKKMLCQRHGNLVRAWRIMFDKTGKGTMGRMNFVRALQKMHYGGDFNEAWRMLDKKGQEIITLSDFAPQEAKRLTEFRRCLQKRFGDAKSAFHALDMRKATRLSRDAFVQAVKAKMDFRGGEKDSGLVFDYILMSDSKTACLTIHEFIWLDYWKASEGSTPHAHVPPPASMATPRKSRAKSRIALDSNGPTWPEILRDELASRAGHLGRAWRKYLDPSAIGICGWLNFVSGVKEVGCSLNIPMAWAAVRRSSRNITLQHLDVELNNALLRLYGALADPDLPDSFWTFQGRTTMDPTLEIPVNYEDYLNVLEYLGMEGDAYITFCGLMEPKGRFVEQGAFQWLANWGAACVSQGHGVSGLCLSYQGNPDSPDKRRSSVSNLGLGTAHMDLVLRRHLGIASGGELHRLSGYNQTHVTSHGF